MDPNTESSLASSCKPQKASLDTQQSSQSADQCQASAKSQGQWQQEESQRDQQQQRSSSKPSGNKAAKD
ncbi:hypothetical protein BGZ58_002443, partial [Dissophora ornata]